MRLKLLLIFLFAQMELDRCCHWRRYFVWLRLEKMLRESGCAAGADASKARALAHRRIAQSLERRFA